MCDLTSFFPDAEENGIQYMDAETVEVTTPVKMLTTEKKKRGRPRKVVLDKTLGAVMKSKASLAKRQHFNFNLTLSPEFTNQRKPPSNTSLPISAKTIHQVQHQTADSG